MNYVRKFLFLLFVINPIVVFASSSIANLVPEEESNVKILKRYLMIHQEFSKQMCSKGEDKKFEELQKDFRGQGFYLPKLDDDNLDFETIQSNIPLMRKKITWIRSELKNLKSSKQIFSTTEFGKKIREELKILLNIKRKYFYTKNDQEKIKLENLSTQHMQKLKEEFDQFTKNYPYLLSFNFPVNHLVMRKNYDDVKDKEGKKFKQKANDIFLQRKILEDGARDQDLKNPDFFLRANLNNIKIELDKSPAILPENLRFDIEQGLDRAQKVVVRGKEVQLQRLEEWLERSKVFYRFYRSIVEQKNIRKKNSKNPIYLVRQEKLARYALRDYVLDKKSQTYHFWSKQPPLMQALFSLETILFNEVGEFDGSDKLERRDVIQVVLNRLKVPFYTSISNTEDMAKGLSNLGLTDINIYPWLNVLFKIGEFSFTYFFIPSSVKIFCPDMSPNGKRVRNDNVLLSLKSLRDTKYNYSATRYFSRGSMLGNIDMTELWSEYQAMPERPGLVSQGQKLLSWKYKHKKFQYLYSFTEAENTYDVIEIDDKKYVVQEKRLGPVFFNYRNVHFFKYFRRLDEYQTTTQKN